MTASSTPHPPEGAALAKLEGRVFFKDHHQDFAYFIEQYDVYLGRSDPGQLPDNPLAPAQSGVHVGLGDSNKLSRTHARILFDQRTCAFRLHCLGKNGLTATLPSDERTVFMTPETPPVPLESRTLIQMGECIFCFVLPAEYPVVPKKRRDWIKAETSALRTLMMRLGYGRWNDIINLAPGRLSEREPEELIPVARRFVSRCYIHARPGVEQKALSEILREEFPPDMTEEDITAEVDALIQDAKDLSEPNEKRKFVRWARKLRLLRRLRDIHDHSSIDRLGAGELRIFTPKPTPYWTDADDVDLIRGSYKHGYGYAEAIRADPELGFHDRYLRVPTTRKSRQPAKGKSTPGNTGDDDSDHDDDDVEDEDDDDLANGNGGSVKKSKSEPILAHNGSPSDSADHHDESDSIPSVKGDDEEVKLEPMIVDSEEKPSPTVAVKKEDENGAPEAVPGAEGTPKAEETGETKTKEKQNGDDAMEVEEVPPPNEEKPMFPTSEALMKRLKSVINACAKEYERDVREKKRATEAHNRAQERKQNLEQRKREKEAERIRLREERKIAKSQPFSKKDAVEFEKALSNFGRIEKEDGSPDWDAFIAKVPQFQNKYHETLDQAFAELNGEAHRLVDMAAAKEDQDDERIEDLKKQTPSTMFTQITLERAEKVLDRLGFYHSLRNEVLTNVAMGTILRGCKKTRELPMWWRSTHDKELLLGVDKHGFNAWDNLARDPEFTFASSMRKHEEDFKDDAKNLKKGVFPKPSAAAKRASNLVAYFRTKATDPHYQQHLRESNGEVREKKDSDNSVSSGGGGMDKHDTGATIGQTSAAVEHDAYLEQVPIVDERATPLDLVDANGHLVLPAVVGEGLYLLELGEIVGGDAFHMQHALFPVGYRAVRQLQKEAFLCEIRRSHEGPYPMFRVSRLHGFQTHDDTQPMWQSSDVVSEDLDVHKAWVLACARYAPDEPAAGGGERFGLYEPTVVHYVQQLPGAHACGRYLFRNFSRPHAHQAPAPVAHHAEVSPAMGHDAITGSSAGAGTGTGILEAMTDALRQAKKREMRDEMDIPIEWRNKRIKH